MAHVVHPERDMGATWVLVVEWGMDGSEWMQACRKDGERVAVLAQQPGEGHDIFSRRVRERIRTWACKGQGPLRVAWLGNGDWDTRSLGHRAALLRVLAARMAQVGQGGSVYLDAYGMEGPTAASVGGPGRHRHALQALAWAASEAARGSQVSIQVGKPADVVAAHCVA